MRPLFMVLTEGGIAALAIAARFYLRRFYKDETA